MKRVTRFQEGGSVEAPMTAAERRRQNIQRLNERRAANRMGADARAEIERFNERMRQGNLTPEEMRRMGGRSDVERFSERLRQGTLTADDMRRMGAEAPQRPAAPAPSMRDAVRPARPGEAPRRPADAMRDAVRPVGPSAGRPAPRGPGIAGAVGTLLALGPAAMEAYDAYRNRPITGEFERSMDPEGSQEAADAYAAEEQSRQQRSQRPAAPAQERRSRPTPRPAPRRNAEPGGTQAAADAERERQRATAPAEERGFFERLGLRRTNETGMEPGTVEQRRNYLGSSAADTNTSYNKKGGLLKAKAPMKKGGAVKKAPAKMMKSGGKVAPKKMMKGGMTSKPKKMMGGGRAMYAKGGMAKGCK